MQLPFILIDTSASDKTYPHLVKALEKGGFLVLSNKKPLSGPYSQFQELMSLGENRIFFETVVGAGLPIIKTIKEMLSTGDEVLEVEGSFSGTLGFIFSELEKGRKFSDVVIDAKNQGFTEPDPRDDLSGLDIARKVLILSRLLGQKLELKDIELSGLVPEELKDCEVEKFMEELPSLDKYYLNKINDSGEEGKVLRFLGKVNVLGGQAGLLEVNANSDIGNLKGPDNMVVIKTLRYSKNPLVVKGPGAGIEVTAAGIFADILEAIKAIKLDQLGVNVLNIPSMAPKSGIISVKT